MLRSSAVDAATVRILLMFWSAIVLAVAYALAAAVCEYDETRAIMYPASAMIGKVASITRESSQLRQNAIMKAPTNAASC